VTGGREAVDAAMERFLARYEGQALQSPNTRRTPSEHGPAKVLPYPEAEQGVTMRGTTWTRRLALASGGSAVCLLALAPLASAQTAPITLSPEESQQVCGDWVPKLQKRADNLEKRINGGAEITGSVANLKARAADQRAKGHTGRADQLDQRATKRQGRVGELNTAKQKLDAFAGAHCKPAAPAPTK
jgi:hypothetical protein